MYREARRARHRDNIHSYFYHSQSSFTLWCLAYKNAQMDSDLERSDIWALCHSFMISYYDVRAIALSLQESNSTQPREIISISDSEDEGENHFQSQLQRAIEASKANTSRSTTQSVLKSESTQSTRSTSAGNFLSERAQMERERLERLKRVRGQDTDDEDRSLTSTKRQHISSSEVHTDRRANSVSSAYSVSSGSSTVPHVTSAARDTIPTSAQLFWEGELRPTANKHCQPRQDGQPTFRLTEVLGPVRLFLCTLYSARLMPQLF